MQSADTLVRAVMTRICDPQDLIHQPTATIATVKAVSLQMCGMMNGMALGLYLGHYHPEIANQVRSLITHLIAECKESPSVEIQERAFQEVADILAENFPQTA